jgi:hypothetical protein
VNLATAGLYALKYLRNDRNKDSLDKVIFEILDVCYRVISWKRLAATGANKQVESSSRTPSYAIEAYLVLLEEVLKVLNSE